MHTFWLNLASLSLEEVVSLVMAAETYKVVNLVSLCCRQIEKLVRPDTVWMTLDRLVAAEAYDAILSCSKVRMKRFFHFSLELIS